MFPQEKCSRHVTSHKQNYNRQNYRQHCKRNRKTLLIFILCVPIYVRLITSPNISAAAIATIAIDKVSVMPESDVDVIEFIKLSILFILLYYTACFDFRIQIFLFRHFLCLAIIFCTPYRILKNLMNEFQIRKHFAKPQRFCQTCFISISHTSLSKSLFPWSPDSSNKSLLLVRMFVSNDILKSSLPFSK